MINVGLINEVKQIYCSTPQIIVQDALSINTLCKIDIASCYFKASRIIKEINDCLRTTGYLKKSELSMNCFNQLPSEIQEHFQVLDIEYKNQLGKKIYDNIKDATRFLNSLYRLEEIIKWFITTAYPKILHTDYDILFESEVRNIDINIFNKKTIDFSNEVFNTQSTRSDINEYIELNDINPHLHLYAINKYSFDIIGALEIYPLSTEFVCRLEKNENGVDKLLKFDEFSFDSILSYDNPGFYSIFVDTIVSHNYFRGKYQLIQKMFEKYFDFFLSLVDKGIFISNVYAEAWTQQGYDLAEYFKMSRIRKTSNGHLFKLALWPPPDFTNLRLAPKNFNILFNKYLETKESMFPKVFISYNHSDIDIVNKIKSSLETNNVTVIIDQEKLQAGMSIKEFIYNSIANSDFTISIVSEKSLLSAWVAMETMHSIFDENLKRRTFTPCFIDKSFLDLRFPDNAIPFIDTRIKEIDSILTNRLTNNRGIEDLQDERTRCLNLKNNLPEIIAKFRNSFCIDLTAKNYDKGIAKLIKDISFKS